MGKSLWKWLLVVCAATGLVIFLYGGIDYTSAEFSEMDFHSYRVMAQASPGLATDINRPFAYRVLGPYVVGLLPIPDIQGFYILTAVLVISLAVAFYFFLCSSGIQPFISATTTMFLILNKYFLGLPTWDYFQVNDILSYIYLIALFWSMWKGRWTIFAITMVLGTLTRETYMLMIPVSLVYLLEKRRLRDEGPKLLVALIPACISFFMLRSLIHHAGGLDLLEAFLLYSKKLLLPENWFRLLINAFVPLSLMPFVFMNRTASFFKDKKYALVYLSLVFLSSLVGIDNERLMAPSFVIFYLLIATIMQEYLSDRGIILSIMTACVFLSSFHHFIGRYSLPRNMTVFLSLGSTAIIAVLAFMVKRMALRGEGALKT